MLKFLLNEIDLHACKWIKPERRVFLRGDEGIGEGGLVGGGGGVTAATTQIKEHKSFPEQFE